MAKLGRKLSRECGMLSFLGNPTIVIPGNSTVVIPGRAEQPPSSCMDGPLSARAFLVFRQNESGSGHVYGLEMRPLTAGPDGDHGSNSNHSGAL